MHERMNFIGVPGVTRFVHLRMAVLKISAERKNQLN